MLVLKNIILVWFLLLGWFSHPFYLSVTDIKYNEKNKTLEVACKMFSNDLEGALKKLSGKKVDLTNPLDKKEMEKILFNYITQRLYINLNGKTRTLKYIGFEREEDVIWTYMEIEKCERPKQLNVINSILYDFLKDQTNLVSIEVTGNKKSSKVSNPEKELKFTIN